MRPQGKILNPLSGKCVNIDGRAGRTVKFLVKNSEALCFNAEKGHTKIVKFLVQNGSDVIKCFFLQYDECLSNVFVLSKGGKHLELLSGDIDDWNITFVDTGLESNIGQRFLAVRKHLEGEEMFLANYADGVSDLPLPAMIDHFRSRDAVASFVGIAPTQTFHLVKVEETS